MSRFTLAAAVTLGLALVASGASAKQTCKDAAGHFAKCPVVAAPPKLAGPCKDSHGKFTKCPAAAPAAVATTPRPAPTVHAAAAPHAVASQPTPAATAGGPAPAGATAKCKDGSFSQSKTHSGSCSHHGGVATWL